MLDTGITPHPEFDGQLLPGYDFVSNVDTARDGDGRDADPTDPGNWSEPGDCGFAEAKRSTCCLSPRGLSAWRHSRRG